LFYFQVVLTSFQEHEAEPRNYRRWLPTEVLGTYTESLDKRYIKREKSFREKLLEAMQWEDNNLSKHIEKHRLEYWAAETRRMAEEAVQGHVDQQTVEGAKSPTRPNGEAH
jgi:nuclear pore complex protein Nup133